MTDRRDDELAARLDELEATLDALRAELDDPARRREVPRPPRPSELLRIADEYAIPAAISALEANVRALELVQAGIRATDAGRRASESGRGVRDRAADAGRTSFEGLDRALAELESALAGRGEPANPEARELLSEARRLNEEVRDRLALADERTDDAVRIEVESELESIREEVEGDGEE